MKITTPGNIPAAITANGTSDVFDVSRCDRGLFMYLAFAGQAGVTPTLDVVLDFMDDDKITPIGFQVGSFAQFTPAALVQQTSTALGLIFPNYARLRWTIGGSGGPTFNTPTLRLFGR